jgi:hypothetical protein
MPEAGQQESGSIPVPLLSQTEGVAVQTRSIGRKTLAFRVSLAEHVLPILFHVDDGRALCRRVVESAIEAADGGAVAGPRALGVCVMNENTKAWIRQRGCRVADIGRLP